LRIRDARDPENPVEHEFGTRAGVVYDLCGQRAQSVASLGRELRARELSPDPDAVEAILDAFSSDGLMVNDDGMFLSLGIPMAPPPERR